MPKSKTDLSRLSLRKDQILELNLAKLPEPPDGMMKLPGVARWWSDMVLARERDTQAFYRMVHTIAGQISEAQQPTTITCTTLPGTPGEPGAPGEPGSPGAPGADGEGDVVLTWMNL